MKYVIVNADDFGQSAGVNEAVRRGHEEGILTSASLVVNAPAAEEAIALARSCPGLGVGLHLVLSDFQPAAPADRVSGLLDGSGRLSSAIVALGLRLMASSSLRTQVEIEIDAQFERFEATGLRLDHVNGHRHFHVHPWVWRCVMKAARRFGPFPIRIPRERYDWRLWSPRSWESLAVQLPAARLRRAARDHGLPCNDWVFGLQDTGGMTDDVLVRAFATLPDGITEIYCHPSTDTPSGIGALPAAYRPEAELDALRSLEVRRSAQASGARLCTFADAVGRAA